MIAVKARYDGCVFVPEDPVSADINQEAIVTILDKYPEMVSNTDGLLKFAGSLLYEDYLEIEKALEDTEKVFPDEW